MQKVKDKIVFITGASNGIGAACANLFAENGAKILMCARRSERLAKLSNKLKQKFSVDVHSLVLDVSDKESVMQQIGALPAKWQQIDVLVNNAGGAYGLDQMQNADVSDWEKMIDINFKGLLYVTRAVLPGMVERNKGHVINIGSISGHMVYGGGGVYCATKHAVNAVGKAMRYDLGGKKIRVSAVDPGMLETEFSLVRFKDDSEKAKKIYEGMIPLTAEDVADAVYYCATRPCHVNVDEIILMPVDQVNSIVYRMEK